ncbi:fatty acyl-AMP ligase [Nocardia sienata]|uniref:fatty acyl-AMP ligase n=1 Tax=Nocardia sienata TaxID=248552 RepID=UPI0007A50B9A|nr:fatty acyl-AMP ligase [Nocardia sienata]
MEPEIAVVSAFATLHAEDPRRTLFVFVDEHGHDGEHLTVHQLAERAQDVRALLRRAGMEPGDRVLLLHLPSLDFIVAFLGCLAAGVIPVPLPPPNPFALAKEVGAVSGIAQDCGARAILTHAGYRTMVDAVPLPPEGAQWPELPWLWPVDVPDRSGESPRSWYRPNDPDEPAFLQYTSGSTGSPKGVVVTHRNIHHELAALAADFELGDDTVAVSWLPHFHDLGLVCVLLNTLVGNADRTYLISPLHFLQRPAIWFEVLSRVGGTHTTAPNFAYDLIVRKTTPQQRAGWDLSSVRRFGTAGETVLASTVEAFFTAFECSDASRQAFHPGYGLAEHTLSVTVGSGGAVAFDRDQLEEGRAVPATANDGREPVLLYGSGWVTKPDARLRIVDPQTGRPCAPREIGEIWVDSPTKARGYWSLEEQTRETFHAVVGDGDPRRYLRTGDLGFLHEDELFVTGRLKDLVIVHGRNYAPQDIEASVRSAHPRIRPGGIAAFSVPPLPGAASERLIVLVETTGTELDEATAADIRRAVRRRVRDDHGLACHEVLVGPKLVQKTTSGKVRRPVCRAEFLRRENEDRPTAAATR